MHAILLMHLLVIEYWKLKEDYENSPIKKVHIQIFAFNANDIYSSKYQYKKIVALDCKNCTV
jgi:hypothetical protein